MEASEEKEGPASQRPTLRPPVLVKRESERPREEPESEPRDQNTD